MKKHIINIKNMPICIKKVINSDTYVLMEKDKINIILNSESIINNCTVGTIYNSGLGLTEIVEDGFCELHIPYCIINYIEVLEGEN